TVYIVSTWTRENVLTSLDINSLRECVSIVRQTAAAIRSIHQAGYLYLDIKPDNISVINGLSKRIQLFDFDSLIPLSALRQGIDGLLAYTRGFAALELRRGQYSKMGFHTDVYGIGALMFYLLFGRVPEAPDCVNGAVFDFSKLRFSGSWPDHLMLCLGNFFRKTLAVFPPDRWQQMDDVIRELDVIEHLSDPIYPCLISTHVSAPACFIGRSREMQQMENWYQDDTQQTLFLTGMGGIGKSTFVRKFIADHHGEWDSVLFLYFDRSIRQTVLSDSLLRINGTERLPGEKEADYFSRKLDKMRGIMDRDRVLLVIDNLENEHDPDLSEILGLNCRTIFITRHSLGSLNLPVLKLEAIQDPDDLLRLFVHYLDREASEDEIGTIREIIDLLDGHTLALELFARQAANSFLTMPEALDLLKKNGLMHSGQDRVDYLRDNRIRYEQLEAIITRLFETDSLSADQISVLKAAALFPAPGISVREFIRLGGITDPAQIRTLILYGWITEDHECIFLHSLIRDVISHLPVTETTQHNLLSVLGRLYEDITGESHKEELLRSEAVGMAEDLRELITDHEELQRLVMTSRGVIDVLLYDIQLSGEPLVYKLNQAMVVNLPKQEDEMILNYGMRLIGSPLHLTPLEILEVFEPVEKVLLERKDFDAAFRLMDKAQQYAVDERTKAEFCGFVSNIYDVRSEPGDQEEMLRWLEAGIVHARRAPAPFRKHLLAEFLLGKLNAFTRNGIEDEIGIDGLITELMEIIERDCLPYSEIRCGFATAMGFYCAELVKDRKETAGWIAAARMIGKKLYPSGLDFIDNCVIPPAVMYLDLGDYDASETFLQEGIRICESHPDLIAYVRKNHDLHRCLLDVMLYAEDYPRARSLLQTLDEGISRGFPDTVPPEVRSFFA
ncbi:MAG: hypothetical protein IKP86_08155, partial [Anaerolineaceae bacterium]|nr:hypothetical protein [Anaerolineaceae bacterium]